MPRSHRGGGHRSIRNRILLLLLALNCLPVLAQETEDPADTARLQDAFIRANMATTEAWIGQKVVIDIELFSPTYFASTPSFYLPQVSGAVLMKTSDAPVLQSQTVNGVEYSVQRHEILVYPQRAGLIDIPPIGIRFTVSGDPPLETEEMTGDFELVAKEPPGASGMDTVITTSSLTVTEDWELRPEKLRAGDAFTRRITVQASDIPGMLLPVTAAAPPDGIRAYPREPLVTDSNTRGVMTGRRTQEISYLCETPGRFTLPEQRIAWWDPQAKELREAVLPALTFKVAGGPGHLIRTAAWIAIPALLMAALAWFWRETFSIAWHRLRKRSASGENARFRELLRACRANEPVAAHRAYWAWRESLDPSHRTALMHPPASMTACVLELESTIYGRDVTGAWSGQRLAGELRELRRALMTGSRYRAAISSVLPELNPPRPS